MSSAPAPSIWPPRRVLVTGAAGFLGQALVAKHVGPLAESGACDVLLTDIAPNQASPAHVRWICGDVADPQLWDRLM